MELKTQKQGDVLHFSLAGLVDEQGARLLKDHFEAIEPHSIKEIVLDCAAVTFIGSAGIGKLLVLYNRVAKNSVKIRLINLHREILENFKSMKLDQLFSLSES